MKILTTNGMAICNNSSNQLFSIKKSEQKKLKYTIINPGLTVGIYTLSFSVGIGDVTTGETNYDVITNVTSIEIDRQHKDSNTFIAKWDSFSWGHIILKSNIEEITI